METRRKAEAAIRLEGSRRGWLGTVVAAYDRDQRHAGGLLSGGLAFRLFLWLLPFCLVLVTSLGFLADRLDRPSEQLAHDAGLSAAVAGAVESAVRGSTKGGLVLFLIGLVLLLWAARSAVRALWVIHVVAWDVEPRPLGRAVTASVAFTLVCTGLIVLHVLVRPLYAGGFLPDLFVTTGLIAADAAGAYAAFRRMPHRSSGWRIFVPGALVFGLGIECLHLVTAVYLAAKIERVDDLYGSLGLAVVILAWLYVIGRLVVASAMLNASMVGQGESNRELESGDRA